MKLTTVLGAIALAVICASPAMSHVGFTDGFGGSSDWEDVDNWTDGTMPVLPFLGANNDESRTHIGNVVGWEGNPAGAINPATVNLQSSQTIGTFHMGDSVGAPSQGTLNHSAGELRTGWVFAGLRGGNAEYNMSGTASFVSRADETGGNVQIFGGDSGSSTGVLRVGDQAFYNGWETWIGTSGNSAEVPVGQLFQTGGTVRTEIDLIVGRENATGFYSLGGGDLSSGRIEINDNGTPMDPNDDFEVQVGGLHVGRFNGGNGDLIVNSTTSSIDVTNLNVGTDYGGDTDADGTILFNLTPGSISPINASGDVWFANASVNDNGTPMDPNDDFNLGVANLTIVGASLPDMDIPLINVGGTLNGTFDNAAEGDLYGGGTHFLTYAGGDGNDIVLMRVPEPSCGVLCWVAALVGLGIRRRR